MTIECQSRDSSPKIAACGQTIEYPFTFDVLNAGTDPDCRYDIQLNNQDLGIPSFTPPQTGVLVSDGPLGNVSVQLYKSYQGGTFELIDECDVTIITTQFKVFAEFPMTDIPFGSVTEAMMESWFTNTDGATSIPFGVEDLSNVAIVDGCMRVRHIPNTTIGETASSRTIFVGNLPDSRCYCAEQTVTLDDPFDYGGPPGNQTIKIGFGLGGGTDVVGGGGNDPCGYTLRWILRGDEIRGYSYAFGRPAGTFGQDIPTGVTAVPGGTYDLKMRLCVNTDDIPDGAYELFIDGALVASDYNVLWMDHTQCASATSNTLNSIIYNSVYGGTNSATQSWWPDSDQFITYCNPCYTATDN